MTPKIRAKRILSHMDRYKECDDPIIKNTAEEEGIYLENNCIGVYQNTYDTMNNAVIIKENGIDVVNGTKLRSVLYKEIVGTVPLKNDGSDKAIIANLTNGEKFMIPVQGYQGKFQDIFEWLRFLKRSVTDSHTETA